ncbi:hypothetical protein [Novosphingopyxis sp.]|uniref:hypothetical protein n=1 Tax=Novosphingopyxis sp. TaxID=2709690 RepID=UPI003B5B2AAF
MPSEADQFRRAQIALDEQNAIREAARLTLGSDVSLRKLSSGLLEAALRTLEEAGMSAEIPTILRAAADKYERAVRADDLPN